MAVKALNKADCEWWSNKVCSTYDSLKLRVGNTIPRMPIDEDEKRKYYLKLAEKELCSRQMMWRGDANFTISVDTGFREGSIVINTYIMLTEENSYKDEERNKYMEERCHKIRDILEPYQKKRDEFLVLIHSRPTQDDLGQIVSWCSSIDSLYKNEKECAL